MKTFRSYSSAETTQFGVDLGERVVAMKSSGDDGGRGNYEHGDHGALVITLQGNLGAGKTTLTQGFARGLGIKRRATSPTFVIMRRFEIPQSSGRSGKRSNKNGAKSHFKNLYHIDAYRLKKPEALEVLGFKEILADPTAIVLVEWPENVKKILPRKAVWVKLRHGTKENERIINAK
jgi:tRNA threonylcarbamoyladenosine biosynthesis protein TsaE